jgi:signal transduction histidine kinase
MGLNIAQKLARAYGGDLQLQYKHGDEWSEYSFILSVPDWLSMKEDPWGND